MAALLRDRLGLRPGDRVATLMHNDPRTVLVYFGAWLLGATVVPINAGETDERVAYILENAEAKALFAMPDQAVRAASLRPKLPLLASVAIAGKEGDVPDGAIWLEDELARCEPAQELPEVSLDTECLIVYTSGTTGAPKGVVLDQGNLLCDGQTISDWHRFGPGDRAMCVLPIHHVNGTVVTLVTPLVHGGSVVLNRRFSASSFWKTLADQKCTWVSVVPTVLAFLSEKAEDLSRYDLSRFRHFICGAGPLTVEVARRFHETFGKRVVHGYGLSETTCYSCFLPPDLCENEYRHWMFECGFPSIGCPVSANEMAIHDASGKVLGEDERGEIVIRGVNVMKGYYLRPEANAEAFAHGWFRSGDEGFRRKMPDGKDAYFITGRLKELIIRGGINISPFDVDEVLNALPGVKAAMAVGFENDFYGEEIGAYVQREAGSSVTDGVILAACREALGFARAPKVVVFGEEFPVTSTGKYQRNRLKPLFAEWRGTQFRE
jgi:long-chain acyl-CoA synthetase